MPKVQASVSVVVITDTVSLLARDVIYTSRKYDPEAYEKHPKRSYTALPLLFMDYSSASINVPLHTSRT